MVLSIVLGIIVFSFVILSLVGILTVLEKNLVPQGDVQLLINDDEEKSPQVSPGTTVLTALGSNGIFLPSACGGGGTCAMCKCQITEGGGEILPTELTHISRKEARDHWRLACQVKVKGPMKIHVPEEIFSIQKFNCTVRSNNNVATFIKELVLDIDDGQTLDFQAGGYIQIDIPEYQNLSYKSFDIPEEYREDWDKYNLWRYVANNDEEIYRAYSMANHPAEGNRVMLCVRIASPPPGRDDIPPGLASSYIFNLKPGDKVVVSGPYGEFFQKKTDREMCFIGGGAGMAPMRSHLFDLFHTQRTSRKVTFWYGARSLREMFYQDDFNSIQSEFDNFKWNVALSDPLPEDNWTGSTGFIHQVVHDEYLSKHEDPTEIEYYLCGPPMMLSAVTNMLVDLGVEKEMIMYDEF
ncbi:MAG: NADH:ubiquinone reductase (Na(+)-transporting) subunit F [Acidobacteria bacterium]|nr:MAG: NADH:ubiquinone reductase (Na(+)-transporting) subunit F [Acidobacteriota bacterium]PIE91462.1 MAG: NADH:ubiquinone reductase (Na(+)-transporting) subunit F [Acidobacteriota bacterium]